MAYSDFFRTFTSICLSKRLVYPPFFFPLQGVGMARPLSIVYFVRRSIKEKGSAFYEPPEQGLLPYRPSFWRPLIGRKKAT